MTFIELEVSEAGRDPEALKHRAAEALERALGFVEGNGDALAVLRAEAVLRVRPSQEVVERLTELQRADGSFPRLNLAQAGAFGLAEQADRLAQDPGLAGTLEALCISSDLSSLNASCVEAAARYLESVQRADGSWCNAECEPADRIFATGMVGGLLGRTHFARPGPLSAAGDFLEALWAPREVVEADWPDLAAFALYFTNVYAERSEGVLAWCGREVARCYRAGKFAALPTLRVLMYCSASALPGADLEPFELLAALLAQQGDDGSFPSLSGAGAVSPTLDAMSGILNLCAAQ